MPSDKPRITLIPKGKPGSTKFQPGNPGSAGRPIGARNRFSTDFLNDFHAAWQAKGKRALERTAEEKPSDFLKAAVALLPRQVLVEDKLGSYDREHAERLLELIDSRLAELAAAGGNHGDAVTAAEPAEGLPTVQ